MGEYRLRVLHLRRIYDVHEVIVGYDRNGDGQEAMRQSRTGGPVDNKSRLLHGQVRRLSLEQ
jgi:hypothetical protein